MIIIIIALATILTFVTWTLISKTIPRVIWGTISIIFLIWSIFFLTDHFVNHTGMKIQTQKTTQSIYTAGEPAAAYGTLIYKNIGKSKILIYRDKLTDQKASTHFIPDKKNITTAIKKMATYKVYSGKKAYLTTVTKRYIWKSKLYELLFGFAGEKGTLVSQLSTVKIPEKTWLILDDSQAKKLQRLAPLMQEKAKKQLQANPQMAQELQKLAKSNPDLYAEKQIETIKNILKSSK